MAAFPNSEPARRAPTWMDVWPQFWVTGIIMTTVIQTGVCLGYSGVLIPQLASDPNIEGMDKEAASWIASLFVGAELFGALGGPLADKFGRKKAMILGQIPTAINWVIMYFTTSSLYPIYVARCICGLGAGLLSSVCYVYIAEMAHAHYRGILAISSSIAVSFGMLLSTSVGVALEWHMASLTFAIMTFIAIAASFGLTESPYWLYSFSSQPIEETMKVVRYLNRPEWLYQEAWTQLEINENMKRNAPKDAKVSQFIDNFKDRTTYIPLILLTVTFILQHATGIYFVIFYSANIFGVFGQDFGFGFNVNHAVILMGILRFLATILSAILSKFWSKNKLIIVSTIIMSVSSIVLVVFMSLCNIVGIDFEAKTIEYSAVDPLINGTVTIEVNPLYTLTGAVALLVYIGAAGMGVMVIPWTLSSDLVSTTMRAFTNAYTSFFAGLLMFLIVKLLPYLLDLISLPVLFSGFAFSSIVLAAFIHFFVPNTFNKEFHEIGMHFAKKNPR